MSDFELMYSATEPNFTMAIFQKKPQVCQTVLYTCVEDDVEKRFCSHGVHFDAPIQLLIDAPILPI